MYLLILKNTGKKAGQNTGKITGQNTGNDKN
jgi:hypothetical protein